MRGPHFVNSHFGGFLVHADFSDLRGIRIGWRRSHACAFVLATPRLLRRRVRTSPRKRAMEINCGDDGFLEGHPFFWTFFSPLLLLRATQNLSLHSPAYRSHS